MISASFSRFLWALKSLITIMCFVMSQDGDHRYTHLKLLLSPSTVSCPQQPVPCPCAHSYGQHALRGRHSRCTPAACRQDSSSTSRGGGSHRSALTLGWHGQLDSWQRSLGTMVWCHQRLRVLACRGSTWVGFGCLTWNIAVGDTLVWTCKWVRSGWSFREG